MDNQTKKRGRGAPTSYKPEYATREYIQGYLDECEEEDKLISICGYSVYIGTSEKVLYSWVKKFPEFSKSLEVLKQKSKEMIIQKSLKGTYNSTIAKLMLSANHGMSEKQQIEHSGDSIVIRMPDKLKDI